MREPPVSGPSLSLFHQRYLKHYLHLDEFGTVYHQFCFLHFVQALTGLSTRAYIPAVSQQERQCNRLISDLL